MSLLHQTLQGIGELGTRLDGVFSSAGQLASGTAMTTVDQSPDGSAGVGQQKSSIVYLGDENAVPTDSATQAGTPAESTIGTRKGAETDSLRVTCLATRPHATLGWPVFNHKYSPAFLDYALETALEDEVEVSGDMNALDSAVYMSLVEDFLTHVHCKNPILDVKTLQASARRVSEVGFEWNGPSCLVALACALGCLSRPYQPASPEVFGSPLSQYNRSEQSARQRHAESFYVIARRRIGLLKRSIVTSQCYFFSAVYCMHQLRPLEACTNLVQASTTYQVYLKSTSAFVGHGESPLGSPGRNLEDRLYWSCFKSESELRVEVDFPESGIADFQYPNLFPAPNIDSETSEARRREQEQVWYYYSTEITLCRIRNRVLNAMYRKPHTAWLELEIQALVQYGEHFLAQIAQCINDLPGPIRYDTDDLSVYPTEELPSLIRARILDIKCFLLRPFVFNTIHKSLTEAQLSLTQHFVDEAISCELHRIRTNSTSHRHHGTWFACRSTMSSAFAIMAAAKSQRINMPERWVDDFKLAIETLRYWESEVTEFTRSRRIMEELLEEWETSESMLE